MSNDVELRNLKIAKDALDQSKRNAKILDDINDELTKQTKKSLQDFVDSGVMNNRNHSLYERMQMDIRKSEMRAVEDSNKRRSLANAAEQSLDEQIHATKSNESEQGAD